MDLSYIADAAWPDDCNAVQVLDDRWLLSTGINIGEVQLFDRVYLGASAILYDAVGVYDMHYTTDGRLLLADYDAGSVLELTQTTVPTPPEVLGIPLAVGRSVTVATPFSIFELPNGDWLIGSDTGLFVYDPATGSQLSQKRATAIRTIELYEGPLPGE